MANLKDTHFSKAWCLNVMETKFRELMAKPHKWYKPIIWRLRLQKFVLFGKGICVHPVFPPRRKLVGSCIADRIDVVGSNVPITKLFDGFPLERGDTLIVEITPVDDTKMEIKFWREKKGRLNRENDTSSAESKKD